MLKTVYFDLGNVLVFVNFKKLYGGLETITGLSVDAIERFLKHTHLQKRYETGMLSTQELYYALTKRAKKSFSLHDFEEAYCDIFTPNEELWPLVETLKQKGVRLILLSNTSECHFEYSQRNYPVLELFDHHILSYKVGAWKPDARIFESALQTANCKPEECFYTDDIEEFVLSARKLGLPSEVFTNAKALEKEIQGRGIQL